MISFQYVQNSTELKQAAREWEKLTELAIDLECENNLHHYGAYVTLIQISAGGKNWIIDVLAIKDMEPLIRILENPEIQKVIHDVSFDLRIIYHQFNAHVKNIFDTQLAAAFLGKEKIGLGALLEEYFRIKKESKFQRVDWTKRPLSKEMLAYAIGDTLYLSELKKKLTAELQELKRLDWVKQEMTHLEKLDWSYHEQTYLDVAGVKNLKSKERGIFKVLFNKRKMLAQETDRPAFQIFNNKQMLAFAKNPPYSRNSWQTLKRVHPLVKERSEEFHQAINTAGSDDYTKPLKKRFSLQQYEKIKEITALRNKLAEKLNIAAHLLLKEEQIRQMVLTNSLAGLREWQKTLLKHKVIK
jgi:ribonuclease D